MLYRNTKTGVVIDVPSQMLGDWVLIDSGEDPVTADEEKAPESDEKPTPKRKRTAKK